MPNQSQITFLVSFFVTFSLLFLLSQFVNQKLKEAGFYFSELILLGIPPENLTPVETTTVPNMEKAATNLLTNGYAQWLALAVALASSVFIYVKFASTTNKRQKPILDAQTWHEFPLTKKIIISPNTAIYRFSLPNKQDVLGLPIGQHISIQAHIDGKDIMRSYTPTSSDDDLGHFDLLIKSYPQGNISRYISLLKIGDKVRVKGPKGQFIYTPTLSRELGMIAGGTGITPMLQIIRAALKNPADKTRLSLIYANVNVEDILLKKELDELQKKFSSRFKIYYVLNNPPEGWTGGVGFVSKEQIQTYLPPTSDDIKILLCGPPPMMNAMKKHLNDLKYPAPRTVSKLPDQVFLF